MNSLYSVLVDYLCSFELNQDSLTRAPVQASCYQESVVERKSVKKNKKKIIN